MFKKILFGLLLSMSITTALYARDSNGVTVYDYTNGMNIDHYVAYNPTSATYVYNDIGGQTATSGSVDMPTRLNAKTLNISVPTLGSTSIDFRLEGKVGTTMTTWADLKYNCLSAWG